MKSLHSHWLAREIGLFNTDRKISNATGPCCYVIIRTQNVLHAFAIKRKLVTGIGCGVLNTKPIQNHLTQYKSMGMTDYLNWLSSIHIPTVNSDWSNLQGLLFLHTQTCHKRRRMTAEGPCSPRLVLMLLWKWLKHWVSSELHLLSANEIINQFCEIEQKSWLAQITHNQLNALPSIVLSIWNTLQTGIQVM